VDIVDTVALIGWARTTGPLVEAYSTDLGFGQITPLYPPYIPSAISHVHRRLCPPYLASNVCAYEVARGSVVSILVSAAKLSYFICLVDPIGLEFMAHVFGESAEYRADVDWW